MVNIDELVNTANTVKNEYSDLAWTTTIKAYNGASNINRDEKLASNVRMEEKHEFVKLIGRLSESDAMRVLILKFVEEGRELTKSDLIRNDW